MPYCVPNGMVREISCNPFYATTIQSIAAELLRAREKLAELQKGSSDAVPNERRYQGTDSRNTERAAEANDCRRVPTRLASLRAYCTD